MNIHRLVPDNWKRLREIRLAALRDSPDAFGSTLADTIARDEANWREQIATLATFIAVVNGCDIGMVRGGPHEIDPATAYLLSMWVAPDHRHRGYGDLLIQAVIGWAKAAGYGQLVLDVADDNQPAVALYTRLGFEPTGETGTLPAPRTHVREHRRALAF